MENLLARGVESEGYSAITPVSVECVDRTKGRARPAPGKGIPPTCRLTNR